MTTMGADFDPEVFDQAKREQEALAKNHAQDLKFYMGQNARPPADQSIKADEGKEALSLVPMQFVRDAAVIRAYGNAKYNDPWSWKLVEPQRYMDALGRHVLAFLEDPNSVDEESGFPHLWHISCNVAFLSDMRKRGKLNDYSSEPRR